MNEFHYSINISFVPALSPARPRFVPGRYFLQTRMAAGFFRNPVRVVFYSFSDVRQNYDNSYKFPVVKSMCETAMQAFEHSGFLVTLGSTINVGVKRIESDKN